MKTKNYNHKTINPQRFFLASIVARKNHQLKYQINYALPKDTNIRYFPIDDHQNAYHKT